MSAALGRTAAALSAACRVPGALPGGVRQMVTGVSCGTRESDAQNACVSLNGPQPRLKSGIPRSSWLMNLQRTGQHKALNAACGSTAGQP